MSKDYNERRDTAPHTARYFVSDWERLEELSRTSHFEHGAILRSCLRAFIEMLERDGKISIPFVMVDRAAAEKAGLVPPDRS
jgi:hypothetical protein